MLKVITRILSFAFIGVKVDDRPNKVMIVRYLNLNIFLPVWPVRETPAGKRCDMIGIIWIEPIFRERYAETGKRPPTRKEAFKK
jgi:hypothetical protein